jgi:hypothetical protein
MVSTRDVNKMLYGALAPDAELQGLGVTGVFDTDSPESQALPLVQFAKTDGVPEDVLPRPAWIKMHFDVKGIVQGNKDLAEQIDNRCNALLDRQSYPVDNGVLMYMSRETDISYAERLGGATYYHVGGSYLVMVRDA